MKQHNFLILISFLLLASLLFSSCSSDSSIILVNTSVTNLSDVKTTTQDVKPVLIPTSLEYLVKLNEEKTIDLDGKTAIVKITGANSKAASVILSIKQGAGENVKQVTADQVISFGALRICIADTSVDVVTGDAQALIIPTYSQKAVSWFSMVAPKNVTNTCDVFTRAVELSSKKDGAATFFLEEFASTSDSTEFVKLAYNLMLGKSLDSLSLQAWEFYVKENGRDKFLALLVASDDFKQHENSIK